jgi:pimeloyl-ACP methyl ester carboxylesterase
MWAQQVADLADVARVSVGDLTQGDTIAAIAASVLDHAPAGKFALAGLSMGGYVALEIMRVAPERILGLALFDTNARVDTSASVESRRAAMARAETDLHGVLGDMLPKLVAPAQVDDMAITALILTMGEDAGVEVFKRQQNAIIGRIDSRPSLEQIRCPTLVLCGREDTITPVFMHEEMASAIPDARLEIIEGCGHISTLGRPDVVSAALRQWLSRLPATE